MQLHFLHIQVNSHALLRVNFASHLLHENEKHEDTMPDEGNEPPVIRLLLALTTVDTHL